MTAQKLWFPKPKIFPTWPLQKNWLVHCVGVCKWFLKSRVNFHVEWSGMCLWGSNIWIDLKREEENSVDLQEKNPDKEKRKWSQMRECLSHLRVKSSRNGREAEGCWGRGRVGRGLVKDHKGAANGGACPSIQWLFFCSKWDWIPGRNRAEEWRGLSSILIRVFQPQVEVKLKGKSGGKGKLR